MPVASVCCERLANLFITVICVFLSQCLCSGARLTVNNFRSYCSPIPDFVANFVNEFHWLVLIAKHLDCKRFCIPNALMGHLGRTRLQTTLYGG